MENLIVKLTPEMLVLVAVVGALLQVAKSLDAVKQVKQWLPFFSIGIALALAYLTKMPDPVLPAIIIGLVASGGYDLLKAPTVK